MSSDSEDLTEYRVCAEGDVPENSMREFDLDQSGNRILLVNQKGRLTALGPKCTHAGAPLKDGYYSGGRIRCPWHGACFNATTGDIEDFPGWDSLPCYPLEVANGYVKVFITKENMAVHKRVKSFVSAAEKELFVIAGAGPAGLKCAETLRQEGFKGQIQMFTPEKRLPYDKVKLTKFLDSNYEQVKLRSKEFLAERQITVRERLELTNVEVDPLKVTLSNGEEIRCSKLFLCMGASARNLAAPGAELMNVFTMRTIDDSMRIYSALTRQSRFVLCGSSFLAMELCQFLYSKVKSVAIITRSACPFISVFGTEIGHRIMTFYQQNGVEFYMNVEITSLVGDKTVEKVILSDDKQIPCDVVVIGIGIQPNTNFLKNSPIKLQRDGTIPVDSNLETNIPNVYAGGDIACAPVLGDQATINHWAMAQYHGHIAAFNMLGIKKSLRSVPFFWAAICGKSFKYVGYCPNPDRNIIKGSLDALKFISFFMVKNQVLAIVACQYDYFAAKFAEDLYQGKKLTEEAIDEWMKM